MKLEITKEMALSSIKKYDLLDKGWTFEFHNKKSQLGVCIRSTKKIKLSKYWVEILSLDEIRDLILHEIAHALTPLHGHNRIWKIKCLEIGAEPRRLYMGDKKIKGKLKATCWNCKTVFYKHRIPRRSSSCNICDEKHYNEKFKLKWILI